MFTAIRDGTFTTICQSSSILSFVGVARSEGVMLVITSERFAEHTTPPGHPESPERAEVMDAVAAEWREHGGSTAEPRQATRDELARVHAPSYLDALERVRGRPARLDPDTYTSPESLEIAALAAGAAIQVTRHALNGSGAAFALVRPPGHHAEADRAMGFCLYNSAAVAAADARVHGASRVAVVDIDVHHGNGTQSMFYTDPAVLYVSTHQYPFYPGTGAAGEVGEGAGRGFTVNIPLEAGATGADYLLVYEQIVVPVVESFAPDVLLVSAGFDAHERDPLAGMRVSTEGYTAIVRTLRELADRACRGRIAMVTEGGYDLRALGACLSASIGVLSGMPDSTEAGPSSLPSADRERGRTAVAAVRAVQKSFWRQL
jgi:acetoin utilization deacetylase AcuC-like enzyme